MSDDYVAFADGRYQQGLEDGRRLAVGMATASTPSPVSRDKVAEALLEALYALERLRHLTPTRANETTADGLHSAVEAIAAAALDRLTPALALAQPAAGWKLMPVEPTQAIIDAMEAIEHPNNHAAFYCDLYAAMLAAAPESAS